MADVPEIHTKEGWLYYAQTDHLSGEEIGSAIDALYAAGAHNVQVISTTTKKNRTGFVFLVDTNAAQRESIEHVLVLDVRVSGWHCIQTEHRHLRVDYLHCDVLVETQGVQVPLRAQIKKCYGVEETLRPEHRSCLALKEALLAANVECSLDTCAQLIRDAYMKSVC